MLRNKISILFILLFLFLLIFSFNSVNAVSSDEYPSFDSLIEETGCEYYIVGERYNNNGFRLILSRQPIYYDGVYTGSDPNVEGILMYVPASDDYISYIYDLDGEEWVLYASGYNRGISLQTIYFSNYDIMYWSNQEEIFFQETPQMTRMAQIVEKSRPEEVVIQIVKVIPLIIVVVVSLVGLRKAWRLLSNLLHQA